MLYVFSIEPSTDGPERGLRCVLIKKQFKISPTFHAAGYKQTTQLQLCNCRDDGLSTQLGGGNQMCEGGGLPTLTKNTEFLKSNGTCNIFNTVQAIHTY